MFWFREAEIHQRQKSIEFNQQSKYEPRTPNSSCSTSEKKRLELPPCHLAPSSHQIGPNFGFIKSFKGKRELAKIETEILRSCSFVRLHHFKTRSRIEGTGSKI